MIPGILDQGRDRWHALGSCHTLSYMASTLSIRLQEQMFKDLRRVCKQQKRAASDVAREALRQYLVNTQLREARRKLRPYAQAKGLLTDDDFFKAIS